MKPFLILLSFVFFSCSGKQDEKMVEKETEIIESYFTHHKFKNTKENFDKINVDLLGIKPDKLQDGYNDILIFNEPTNYQISKEGKYTKIGNDILPDLDNDSPATKLNVSDDPIHDNKNKFSNINQSENSNTINSKFIGHFSVTQTTEETTTGTAFIKYSFSIKKDKAILVTETYQEPIICNGDYKTLEKNDILELYYSGNEKNCKSAIPNFKIKKENNTYFIKGVGGEATFNEWIQLDKTK